MTKKKTGSRIAAGILTAVFLLLFLFFAGFLPAKPVAVATGSMEPAIQVGDAAVIVTVNTDELKAGDVIQYRKENYTVIHRIIEVTEDENGKRAFITQGDNNPTPDADPVPAGAVVGKMAFCIPKIGSLSLWLRRS